MPEGVTGLAISQYSPEVVYVRLPPKAMVEKTEAALQGGAQYPVPPFYDEFYQKQLDIPTLERRLDFHAARIGDYAVRNCT